MPITVGEKTKKQSHVNTSIADLKLKLKIISSCRIHVVLEVARSAECVCFDP